MPKRKNGMGSLGLYNKVYKNGVRTYAHIVKAEKALGKSLPPKAVVHHFYGERKITLVICPDQGYHMLLHQRERWLKTQRCL